MKATTILADQSIGPEPSTLEPAIGPWESDDYARAYVLELLIAVNLSPAIFTLSNGRGGIDYHSYISTFAGSQFLHPYVTEAPLDWHLSNQVADPSHTLSPEDYFTHFQNYLNWEWKEQLAEYRSYDMFRVTVMYYDLNYKIL